MNNKAVKGMICRTMNKITGDEFRFTKNGLERQNYSDGNNLIEMECFYWLTCYVGVISLTVSQLKGHDR